MITLKMLDQESWYQEAMEKDDSVYFLPKVQESCTAKIISGRYAVCRSKDA